MEFIDKVREGYAAFGAYQTWWRCVTATTWAARCPSLRWDGKQHFGPGQVLIGSAP